MLFKWLMSFFRTKNLNTQERNEEGFVEMFWMYLNNFDRFEHLKILILTQRFYFLLQMLLVSKYRCHKLLIIDISQPYQVIVCNFFCFLDNRCRKCLIMGKMCLEIFQKYLDKVEYLKKSYQYRKWVSAANIWFWVGLSLSEMEEYLGVISCVSLVPQDYNSLFPLDDTQPSKLMRLLSSNEDEPVALSSPGQSINVWLLMQALPMNSVAFQSVWAAD